MKRRLPSLLKSLHFRLLFKLTPLGRAAVVVIFVSAVGVVTVEVPVHIVFFGIMALFLIAEVLAFILRPHLKVTGSLPSRVKVGEQAVGSVTVQNLGRLPVCDLMCGLFGLPPGIHHLNASLMVPILPHGQQTTIPVVVQAKKRGEFDLPVMSVHSTFPLNLVRSGSASVPTRKLTVLPTFHKLEHFETPLSHRYQTGGIVMESRMGDAPEYIGNRDYIPGEPVRRLDFRAWARIGRPVVREYQDEYSSRVALVLDTHSSHWLPRIFRSKTNNDVEAAVSLTAAIADYFNQIESTIDLFAAGPDLFLFQTPSGETHFESVLEILAAVEVNWHNPFEKLSPVIAESLESTSVVVCVFVDWDDSREELTQRIQECGCQLKAILIRSRPPTKPFPEDENHKRLDALEVLQGKVQSL